jgi:DedD protein
MALLDNTFKQRMVGALVLIALAVIFLPMLFSRQDEMREVRVEAPAAPQAPVQPQVQVQPVQVPQQQPVAQEPIPQDADMAEEQTSTPLPPAANVAAPAKAPASVANAPKPAAIASTTASKPSMPIGAAAPSKPAATPPPAVATAAKPAVAPPAPAAAPSKIDPNGLPVSWSVQLASLSSRDGADNLQKTLRTQGYNAYVRSADGKNRVYVGPLVDRAEAERLRDTLNRQQSLKGFVVRFEPERG